MKITTINSYNKNTVSFSSGLYSVQRKFINNLDTVDIAQKIQKDYGIKCDFADNKIVAGLCAKTIKIFKKLGLNLPNEIFVEKFPYSDRKIMAQSRFHLDTECDNYIRFNTRFFNGSVDSLNEFVDQKESFLGSKHILNPFIHEFLHIHHGHQLNKDFNNYLSTTYMVIPKKFRTEIEEKIAEYGSIDYEELYSTYYAKEICNALNKRWHLNYNPLENPKINLSTKLREYVNALENPQKLLRLTYENMD